MSLACVAVLLGLVARPAPVLAASAVEVRCPTLSPEQAAAFEARAHAELLVRGSSGRVRLSCEDEPTLEWLPEGGFVRQRTPDGLGTDALLSALASLLAEVTHGPESPQPSGPSRPARDLPSPPREAAEPPPLAEIRLGPSAHLWDGQPALGGRATVGFPLELLTVTAGGNLSAGYLSYERVALWLVETRVGLELTWPKPVLSSLGAGAGRPFTTETSTVTQTDQSPSLWFVEGFARAALPIRWSNAWRLHLGAELVLLSRPIRLRVDEVVAYDFGWQPGVFLEVAFAVR